MYQRKDTDAYRAAIQRLQQQQHNVDKTVDEVQNVPDATDKIDSIATKTQAKPARRLSQSLQVKPKVCMICRFIFLVV